jgi:hypothetical protein
MNMAKAIVAVVLLGSVGSGLSGCKKEGPAERAGKEIDKSVEKAGQEVEKAGEHMKEALNSFSK